MYQNLIHKIIIHDFLNKIFSVPNFDTSLILVCRCKPLDIINETQTDEIRGSHDVLLGE